MLAAGLLAACAGPGTPAESPSAPREREGQLVTLHPGTPEYRAFFEQIHADILRSRTELEPILLDGDVAQLTIEGEKLSVERIDETRARRIAAVLEHDYPEDEVSPRWFRRRDGPGRIFVIMGEGTLLFNIDEKGIGLEPGSLDADRAD